jgi:hypothetical protein
MGNSEWNGGLSGQKVALPSRTFLFIRCPLLFRAQALFGCDEARIALGMGITVDSASHLRKEEFGPLTRRLDLPDPCPDVRV